MNLPLDAQLALLSDTELYDRAVRFIHDWIGQGKRLPQPAQLYGLLGYADRWDELKRFVQHQARKDKAHYVEFYQQLDRVLKEVEKLASARLQSGADRRVDETRLSAVGQLYIQHLTSEALLQRAMEQRR